MVSKVLDRNLPYIKQQTSALLVNTSTSVKIICVITICGYFLSYSNQAIKSFSVTPAYLFPPSLLGFATIFTFCFIELYLWEVLLDIIIVGLYGKLIEPLWGQMEMMKFFAITNIGVAILSSTYYLFVYACTGNPELLFEVHIHGLSGFLAAVCVGVRQIMPDLLIAKTRIGKLTNRNMPLTLVFISIVLWLCGILDGTTPTMFVSGLIVSWIYLRFYQRHGNGNRGDGSESFTFASFFPNVLQPAITSLVAPLHKFFLSTGVIKPQSPSKNTILPMTSAASSHNSSTYDIHDMERRRQIALKALSERLMRSTDSSKQKVLPKSFPMNHHHQHGHSHGHGHGHSHGGQHQHHHHGSDSDQPSFLAKPRGPMEFTIPAIPLPPPPSMITDTASTQSTNNPSTATLVDLSPDQTQHPIQLG